MEDVLPCEGIELPQPRKKNRIIRYAIEAGIYASSFLLALVFFLIFKPLTGYFNVGLAAQSFIVIGLLSVGGAAAYLGFTKKLTVKRTLILLLVAGFILRLGYMLYTPASTRQHDTYTKSQTGHEAYAWIIFSTGKFPSTNSYQFYHPPLNALLQAGFMKCVSLFTNLFSLGNAFFAKYDYGKMTSNNYTYLTNERYFLYSTCQILSVIYSIVTCIALVKTIWLFRFSDKTKLLLSAFVIFFPRNIFFAGMLNNDPLSYMFAMLAFYHSLKWWKGKKSLGRILVCALCVGFGMMAKLSSATVCLPIAGIFIYEFVRTLVKELKVLAVGKMILQYNLFLLVCAPIGLWFQVYAKICFNQDFGYVFSNLIDKLYTGDKTLFSRFFLPDTWQEIFGFLWCNSYENYYLFNFALRSALFTESSYSHGEAFAVAAIVLAYLFCALLCFALAWTAGRYFYGKKKGRDLLQEGGISLSELLVLGLLLLSQIGSEIYFYIKMPYGCTMDFRYIMPLILGMAWTMGSVNTLLTADGNKVSILFNRLLIIVSVALLATTSLFFCVCV